MSYYRNCPICGAYLDPGERCECETDRDERPTYREKMRPDRADNSVREHAQASRKR